MLLSNLNLLATAPGSVARLRELILTLAVQGKLVPQDPNDEPASALLKKIRAEKDRLIAEGKIKRDKPLAEIAADDRPFEAPIGWEWVRLGDVVLISSGVTLGRKTAIPSPVSLPYVRVANVQRWHLNLSSMKEVVIDNSELERYKLAGGDLLITEGGDWDKVGRTSIWRNELLTCLHQNHVFKARGTSTEWNPVWAELFLNSSIARSYFASSAKQTTNLASINMTQLKDCVFPVPPVSEQSRIVTRVEELMRLCDALEAKGQLEATQHAQLISTLLGTLTESETPEELAENWQRVATHFDLLLDRPKAVDALEQTILQLAVRGLLVPQDPQDEPASELLKKIRAEKDKLIAEGKIKRDKPQPPIAEEEQPYALPQGWEWVRLQQAYDVRDGTHDTPKYQSTGYPLVTSKNIYAGVLDLSDVKLISPADHEQISARSKVDRSDILFAMIGSIGNPVLVDTDIEFSVKNVALFKYYAPRLSYPSYLLLVLQTEAAGMKERAAGAVQSFISLGQLRSGIVALPPLAEQARIVARVAALRALCADLRQRLADRQSVQARLAEELVASVAA
jgi:type I restriction enzyme S subunit